MEKFEVGIEKINYDAVKKSQNQSKKFDSIDGNQSLIWTLTFLLALASYSFNIFGPSSISFISYNSGCVHRHVCLFP